MSIREPLRMLHAKSIRLTLIYPSLIPSHNISLYTSTRNSISTFHGQRLPQSHLLPKPTSHYSFFHVAHHPTLCSSSSFSTSTSSSLSSSSFSSSYSSAPKSSDRGPTSNETTQTDFGKLDVLGSVPPPASSIDVCLNDGFVLSNGVRVDQAGVLLVGGEVFRWKPWERQLRNHQQQQQQQNGGGLLNGKGLWDVGKEGWGVLGAVWPRPDLLVIGTGPSIRSISPETRRILNEMGIRVEIADTRNAAAQYNLLATERGVHEVAAALVPIGFKK